MPNELILFNKIDFLPLENGLFWPHYGKKKALSASSLTRVLKEFEYKDIPKFILLRAAKRGKDFHSYVQKFVKNNVYPDFVSKIIIGDNKKIDLINLSDLEKRVYESIYFLKKQGIEKFIGCEKLHYCFYKGTLLATYLDLEFEDFVIELKSNSKRSKDSVITLLSFEIQLLIQYLCTKKKIFLFWITEDGIYFEEFKIKKELFDLLDMLIKLNHDSKNLNYKLDSENNTVKSVIAFYIFNGIKKIIFEKRNIE